nr:MAG TPA: hypothetical protein [Caudoviricetes sp.]
MFRWNCCRLAVYLCYSSTGPGYIDGLRCFGVQSNITRGILPNAKSGNRSCI